MSVFHQPNFEAYFNLQCEALQIPLYRRWNFVESKDNGDETHTVRFQRNTNGLRDVYNHRVDVQCKWLIGCDGANSAVRQQAGLKQQDLQFQYDWLVVDLVSVFRFVSPDRLFTIIFLAVAEQGCSSFNHLDSTM